MRLNKDALLGWLSQTLRHDNLSYLTWYMFVQLFVIVMTCLLFNGQGISLPKQIYLIILPSQIILMLATYYFYKVTVVASTGLFFSILTASIILLVWYLFQSGGHTNPVISLLLVPLAMSAVLLVWQPAVLIALMVVISYSILTRYFVPLSQDGSHSHHMMQLHLSGMWLMFIISVVLILGVILPMATSVRIQQEKIAEQREKGLKDEKIISMATFAASAAHQLGTPLSTMAVLADDMKEYANGNLNWEEDIALLTQQIGVCKLTLHEMMRRSSKIKNNENEPVSVQEILVNLQNLFNLLYPNRCLHIDKEGIPAVLIAYDATLDQALLNLIDNAVRESEEDPVMSIELDNDNVCLRIIDKGQGIPDSIVQQIGTPFVESKKDGLGLGLFLSHSTINRLGGTLKLLSRKDGTVTEIWLPIVKES